MPAHVKDGAFGKWLENARDWSITRNRFWGSPIPVWKSDDPRYPRVDVYGIARRARARLRRAADRPAPAVHRRAHPAQPRRPDRAVDDAPGRGRPRLLVRVRVDAVRPGALPVREPGVVRAPLPGRLHRRVHRPDARAGSTRCTCWPPPCSTSRRSGRASPTASSSATTARRCPSRCGNYPDPDEVFDTLRRRRPALVAAVVAGAARRRPDRRRRASVEARPRGAPPALEHVVVLHPLRQRRGPAGHRTEPHSTHVLDRYILAKTRALVESVTAPMDAYDLSGACAAVAPFLDALTNWYIRRSRDRFWGRRRATPTCLRHPGHRPRGRVPGGRAAAAPGHRGDLDRASPAVPTSVHLTDWPAVDDLPADADAGGDHGPGPGGVLGGSSVRKAKGLRVRLPAGLADRRRAGRRRARPLPRA